MFAKKFSTVLLRLLNDSSNRMQSKSVLVVRPVPNAAGRGRGTSCGFSSCTSMRLFIKREKFLWTIEVVGTPEARSFGQRTDDFSIHFNVAEVFYRQVF